MRMAQFDKLRTLDTETKQRIREQIVVCVEKLVSLYRLRNYLLSFTWYFFGLVGVSLTLLCVSFTIKWLKYLFIFKVYDIMNIALIPPLVVAIILFILKVIDHNVPALPKSFRKITQIITIIIFLALLIIIFLSSGGSHLSFQGEGIALGLLFIVLLMTFLLIFNAILNLISSAIRVWMCAHHPIVLLIDDLISILISIEDDHAGWVSLESKQRQLLWLEEAAKCIQDYLPRRLRCGDIVTDAWQKETTKQFAAALREKKRWLLTPKRDTYEYFVRSIAFTLICISDGNWDSLERREPEKPSFSQVWQSRIFVLLRAFCVALLPVVGFWVIQWTPLALKGTAHDAVAVGVFIWASLTFIALLDANFSTKISAIKDITSLLFPFRTNDKS